MLQVTAANFKTKRMCMNEISTWNFYLAVMLCSLSIFSFLKSVSYLIENIFPTVLRKLLTRNQSSYCHIFLRGQVVAVSPITVWKQAVSIAKNFQNNIYQTTIEQSAFAAIGRYTHIHSLTNN